MFGTDQKTHLGYLRYREHINNSHQNSYQSVAAFDPRDSAGTSRFRIFDLDAPGVTFRGILKDYASAVQNLRLVKRPGRNQWGQQERKWSEAALGARPKIEFLKTNPSREAPHMGLSDTVRVR